MILRKSHGKKSIGINPLPSDPRHHHGAPREVALVAAHKGALAILAAESRRESRPRGVSTCETPHRPVETREARDSRHVDGTRGALRLRDDPCMVSCAFPFAAPALGVPKTAYDTTVT